MCKQRSDAWYEARRGIPTASRFSEIVTPTGKPRTGKGRASYLRELVADSIWGVAPDGYESWQMERGRILEPHARAWYSITTKAKVHEVGFVYADESMAYGCSPDGIVGDDGGIEIKCPESKGYRAAILGDIDEDYIIQAHGNMWVCGRKWWDLVYYTETTNEGRGHIVRIDRNDEMCAALAANVPAFAAEVRSMVAEATGTVREMAPVRLVEIADHLGPAWMRYAPPSEETDRSEGIMEASQL